MHVRYKIDNSQIDDMLLTIEIAMTVAQWRELMRTKSEAKLYEPFGKLQAAISTALGDLSNATNKQYEHK